ncbi:MAG: hypothetical protein CMF59_15920 [Leptospiraceae bacterium]|nr:hypothetical protein [Leptospiraceae bacterium]
MSDYLWKIPPEMSYYRIEPRVHLTDLQTGTILGVRSMIQPDPTHPGPIIPIGTLTDPRCCYRGSATKLILRLESWNGRFWR